MDAASWVVFPCKHGCCTTCLRDLVRYNNTPGTRHHGHVISCCICRQMVVAGDVLPRSSGAEVELALQSRDARAGEPTDPSRAPSHVHFLPLIPPIRI
jgi:hypothetical protein